VNTSLIDLLLARGVVCRALRFGLQPPTEESARALFSPEGRRALERAAIHLDRGEDALRAAAADLARLPVPTVEDLAAGHAKLFGHTLRGAVCPYETEYGRGEPFLQAHELADISGSYLAFGLRAREVRGERPDHIVCEFEYLEFLCLKEIHALEGGDQDMVEVTRRALRCFLRDHLARFGLAFGAALAHEDAAGFHGALGRLCVAFLTAECVRLNVSAGPERIELRSTREEDVPMACGSGPDLIQIGSPARD